MSLNRLRRQAMALESAMRALENSVDHHAEQVRLVTEEDDRNFHRGRLRESRSALNMLKNEWG